MVIAECMRRGIGQVVARQRLRWWGWLHGRRVRAEITVSRHDRRNRTKVDTITGWVPWRLLLTARHPPCAPATPKGGRPRDANPSQAARSANAALWRAVRSLRVERVLVSSEDGLRLAHIMLRTEEVAALRALGYLPGDERPDAIGLGLALGRLLDRLGPPQGWPRNTHVWARCLSSRRSVLRQHAAWSAGCGACRPTVPPSVPAECHHHHHAALPRQQRLRRGPVKGRNDIPV